MHPSTTIGPQSSHSATQSLPQRSTEGCIRCIDDGAAHATEHYGVKQFSFLHRPLAETFFFTITTQQFAKAADKERQSKLFRRGGK
jgi:hypothetical protein